METKYGSLANQHIILCLDDYVNKVFKILPMREEGCKTLDKYIASLLREFIGNHSLVKGLQYEPEFLSLIGILENLAMNDVSFEVFRSDVFKSIAIIKKMQMNLGEDRHGS